MENRTVLNMLKEASVKFKNKNYTCDKADSGYVGKTYADVRNEAISLAASMAEMGIKKDDKLAILAEGRSEWIVSEFATLMCGGVCVPLSIQLLPEEVLFRLNHAETKAIFVSRNTFEKVASIWKKIDYRHFKIIYLDDNADIFTDDARKFGISTAKDVVTYKTLVAQGLKNMQKSIAFVEACERDIKEDDVVSISYTSGTTGNPKGIMLTHLNYYSNSQDAINYFNIELYYRLFIVLPLDHSFAHTVGIFASLVRGLSLYFVDSRGGAMAALKNMAPNLKEANPHFMLTVPAITGKFMNKIIDSIEQKGGVGKKIFDRGMAAGITINGDGYRKASLPVKLANMFAYKLADKLVFAKIRKVFGANMKFCVGGGALLDVKQQRFYYTLGIPVFQGYGLTEATPIISANTPEVHKMGTSGKVIPGVKCKIILKDGSKAKVGEKGEIVIQGNNVMKGYYKNPDASAESLRNGWLYTSDMGYYDKDGFLMVVGREKALLISPDGEKYSPESIEEAIVNCSDLVAQVMLYNDHRKYTVALITLDKERMEKLVKRKKIADPELLLKEIKKSFYSFREESLYAKAFPEKWIPSGFRIIEEPFSLQNLMINSTLKMVRHKITEVYIDRIEDMYNSPGDKIVNEANMATVKRWLPFN